jgi:hypothetical protein
MDGGTRYESGPGGEGPPGGWWGIDHSIPDPDPVGAVVVCLMESHCEGHGLYADVPVLDTSAPAFGTFAAARRWLDRQCQDKSSVYRYSTVKLFKLKVSA